MNPILPEQYGDISAYELLSAASLGHIAFDHRLLHCLLDEPPRTLPDIVRFANEPERTNDRVDVGEALEHIFAACPTPEALPFLLRRLREEEEAPEILISAISRLGAFAIPVLIRAFEESGRDAGDIPFVLATMGARDSRIVDALVRLFDEEPEHAVFCLSLYGGPDAKDALQQKLQALPAEEDELRQEIKAAIRDMPEEGRPAQDEEFNIWEHFPEEADPDLWPLPENELAAFLDSPNAAHRLAAVNCCEELPELAAEQRDRLLGMARGDSDARVRGACWSCLELHVAEPFVIEEMQQRLSEPGIHHEELAGLVLALAGDAYDERVRQGILRLYETPESRAAALGSMWRSQDSRFGSYFSRHLEDRNVETRRQAILGVGHFGLSSEIGRLRISLEDEDLREDALYAYAMAAPGLGSRSQARWFFRRVAEAVGDLTEEEEFLVMDAIDTRLDKLGMKPVFVREEEKEWPAPYTTRKVGRNEPCPCGSGKKFKRCCGA